MSFKKNLIGFIILGIFLPFFSANAGTILSSYKYAWGSNVGYINFENVVVGDSALSGYAWSENAGWIKFNPALGGVLNDGAGNLSGSAWGEGLGWIDFDNVTINTSTGRFSGTATGDGVGTINFDCPNYCDVRTDWNIPEASPTATVTPVPINYSSGSRANVLSSNFYVESNDKILEILKSQSGKLVVETKDGQISIIVQPNTTSSSSRMFLIVEDQIVNKNNSQLILKNTVLINGTFYEVYALDENEKYIKTFVNPITITLPIGVEQRGMKNLRVYWLNEVNKQWVLIPEAVFLTDKVTFNVNHLTKFAIFSLDNKLLADKNGVNSLVLPNNVNLGEINKVDPTSTSSESVNLGKQKTGDISKNQLIYNYFDSSIFIKLLLMAGFLLIIIVFVYKKSKK